MDVSEVIKAGGGPLKLSKALGCDHSSVIGWRTRGQVPVERVLPLERLLGIPRHDLRPDIYPPPDAALPT